jgi:DNA-binding NtrC family response regulator
MNETLRVLVVDDEPSMASTLADILGMQGYQTIQAHSAEAALELAHKFEFFCVISDIVMPGMNGAELCAALHQIQPDLPVVLMTAYASEELTAHGMEMGALAVLDKPLDLSQVLNFLALLSETQLIAIVDDDQVFCRTLGDILSQRGYTVKVIIDAYQALSSIDGEEQVILLDMKLKSVDGHEVLQRIRQRYPKLPVLLVTAFGREMATAIEKALDINAYACLYKPLVMSELFNALAEIRSRQLKKALGHP